MADIGADYLGGDPKVLGGQGAGGKLVAHEGGLAFDGHTLDAALSSVPIRVVIPKNEIRAITVGSANHMKTLTRAVVGEALGGSIGALIGAATGKRNHVFLVAAARDGFEFFVSFGVRGDEGSWLLNAMQAGRLSRGEPRLALVEDLVGNAAADASDRQLATLARIEVLLERQVALLDELVQQRRGG